MERTALVTGASSGIGKATAEALVARGYRVIGTSRHPADQPGATQTTQSPAGPMAQPFSQQTGKPSVHQTAQPSGTQTTESPTGQTAQPFGGQTVEPSAHQTGQPPGTQTTESPTSQTAQPFRGQTVEPSAHQTPKPADHRATQPAAGIEFVELDLALPGSVEALAPVLAGVDVLVNNAGESQSGPFEELPGDALRRLFEINVLGPVRLAQLALPGMRERGYGRVVMVGSMLASFPLSYRSSYVASKAALRGFASGARHEYSPFGVWLTTVEPGSINTGISERRTRYTVPDSPHRADFERMLAALDRNEGSGTPASRVAATIVKAIESQRPRQRYAVGSRAPLSFAARRLLPAETIEKLTHRQHGLRR